MKKGNLILLVSALMCVSSCVLAQDPALIDIAKEGVLYAISKWPVAAQVVGAIGVISEILSIIPSKYLPVNGVADTIIKFFKAVFGKPKA
jgi:hypothetical protein